MNHGTKSMTAKHVAQKINEKTGAGDRKKRSWKDFNADAGEEIKAALFAKGKENSP